MIDDCILCQDQYNQSLAVGVYSQQMQYYTEGRL